MFPVMLAVGAGIQLGLPILKRLFGTGKLGKWFDVFEQASQGVPSAVDAVTKLNEFQRPGARTPTNEELDAVLAESHRLSDEITR